MAGSTLQPVPTPQRPDLQQEAPTHQLGTQSARKLSGGPGRTTRGQNVVHYQDPVALPHSIAMSLQGIAAIFQIIGFSSPLPWQLAGFACGDEPGTQCRSYRSTQDEATSLDAQYVGYFGVAEWPAHLQHHFAEERPIPQDRRDVLKLNPGFGIVRDDPQSLSYAVGQGLIRDPKDIWPT